MTRKKVPLVHWKETVIRIKWSHVRLKPVDDGDQDFTLTLPLTAILQDQAKHSFMMGVAQALAFVGQHRARAITDEAMDAQMTAWGLADAWAEINKDARAKP